MSIVIIILLAIAVLLAIVFIAAMFAPSEFSVYSVTVINKPLPAVFNYIRLLKNQERYNKWVMQDPNLTRDFTGTDGTVGCIYYWDSKMGSVGKGEQEITQINNDVRIDWAIRFKKPFENEAGAYMETTAVTPTSTNVKWVFTGKLTYMMKVMHIVLSLKKMLTKDLSTSLQNLKGILEN
jgi:hypothetical protein